MGLIKGKSGQISYSHSGEQNPPEALLVGCVLFITALLYAATLRFNFVYDDAGQIGQNVFVHFWRYVPKYFQGQVWSYLHPNAAPNYYRPLNLLWFRVNDALFGLHPAGWHATAVGLHLLATFLVYKIAQRVTGRPLVATLTALIFAVHPTRHEVVAWVSGTTESLWAVLFLAALLSYLQSRESHRFGWMGVSCLLYAMALLSKETAIVLPAVVFAHACIYIESPDAGEPRRFWHRMWRAAAFVLTYAPVVIVYLVVRIHVLHGFSHAVSRMSLGTFAFTLPSVLFFYVKQWCFPIQISEFYDMHSWSHFSVRHVLLPLLGFLFVVGVVWFFRRKLGAREVAFAVACIIIPLAPAMDLAVLPPGELAHDRYFYIPGFGAALLVSLAFEKLAQGKMVWRLPQRWLLAVMPLLILLCYDTANASSYWVNNYVLYSHAYRIAPQDFILRNNYARELELHGDIAGAINMFQSILKQWPNNHLANFNMGRCLYLVGLYPAAAHYLEIAQRSAPQDPDTYLELALVDLRTNRAAKAEANLRHAIAIRPEDPMFHYSLGVLLKQEGNCTDARPQFTEALTFSPGFRNARKLMEGCVSDTSPAQGDPVRSAQGARPKAQAPARHNPGGVVPDPQKERARTEKPSG